MGGGALLSPIPRWVTPLKGGSPPGPPCGYPESNQVIIRWFRGRTSSLVALNGEPRGFRGLWLFFKPDNTRYEEAGPFCGRE